jgi:hypothetical protein
MSEILEGVIHGKTIELESDPGLRDSERVEVMIRRADRPRTWGEGIKATAGVRAHLPPEYFADLDEIVRDRQQWPHRVVLE